MIIGPIIGHRGAAALAPENTLISFDAAYQKGCRSIECDVQLSVDGEAFIFHDDTLNRTTNGKGLFAKARAEDLRHLDAGSWFDSQFSGTRIPSLKDALLWAAHRQVMLNLELKPQSGGGEALVQTVLTHLKEYWPATQPLPLISSFDLQVLQWCRQYHETLPLGCLLATWQDASVSLASSLQCVAVNLSRRIVTQKRINFLKQRDFWVYVYTVNQQSMISTYRTWGADGVFSDYPTWIWS